MLFAGLVGAASPAFAVRTLGLSSPSFDFNVAPGGTGNGDLFVINDGTEPLRVLVYFSNQTVDAKGQQTFQTPTRDSNVLSSPASWCQVQLPKDTKSIGNVPFLDLKPKERVPVKFSFDVPQGVPPGDHQVFLFFEMIDTTSNPSGVATSVQGRLGSHIRIRVQGAVNEALDVRPFTIRQFIIGDGLPWQFTIRNDGNIDENVSSSLVVLDGSENERITSEVVTGTLVYANTLLERAGNLSLKDASLGQFTVRLTTKYSDGSGAGTASKTVVKDRTVWVVPLWLAIVVVAVVGLLALWLSWRAAVHSAERRLDRRDRRAAGAGTQQRRASRSRSGRAAPAVDDDDYGDEYEDVDAGSGPAGPPAG
jgi:hypothetical protein